MHLLYILKLLKICMCIYYVTLNEISNVIFQYMNLIPEMPLKGGITLEEDSLKGEVKFNNVSFVYPTRPDQVL